MRKPETGGAVLFEVQISIEILSPGENARNRIDHANLRLNAKGFLREDTIPKEIDQKIASILATQIRERAEEDRVDIGEDVDILVMIGNYVLIIPSTRFAEA